MRQRNLEVDHQPRVCVKNLSAMSAQNGDTVMQEDALDQEEELAFGEDKLKVVSIFHSFLASLWRVAYSICNGHNLGL